MKKIFTEHGTVKKSFYRAWNFSKKFLQSMEFFAAALLLAATAARAETFEVQMRLEQFVWEEFADGEKLLEEEGPRVGIGLRGTAKSFPKWRMDLRADGFLGRVEYDGQTFAGDPLRENTDYIGVRGELDAALRPPAPGLRAHPRLGVGARYWLRRLARGDTDAGGYDEGWFTLYGRIGADLVWTVDNATRFFVNIARRPALYNRTWYNIRIEDEETFSLEPGREWTWDVEAGWVTERYRFSVFYETYAFEQSNSKVIPPLEVFQPKSEGRAAGVSMGVMW
jgi:hypothetical protein